MNFAAAVSAGLIGTFVMTVAMYAGKIMGLPTDMPGTLGLYFVRRKHPRLRYMVGFGLHLMLGMVFGLIYAALLTAVGAGQMAGAAALWGALFGLLQSLVVGPILGMMPVLHPDVGVGREVEAPGLFGNRIGMGMPVALFVLHAVYGAVVGVSYAALSTPG